MAHATHLALELIDIILGFLDDYTLKSTLRTAKFLRYPSERRLYSRVALPTSRASAQELARINGSFLETIAHSERLGRHVVELVLGSMVQHVEDDKEEEQGARGGARGQDQVDRTIIEQAMKRMVNLKKLYIFGYFYIAHAHLDSVPFSLTSLGVIIPQTQKSDEEDPDLPFLAVLQAHPDIEDLTLECPNLPLELVSALRKEQEECPSVDSESQVILCPKLKRFDGCHQSFRLLLHPARRFLKSVSPYGRGGDRAILDMDQHLSIWQEPILKPSYQRLQNLEVYPNELELEDEEGKCLWFFPTIATHLTSLTHLLITDHVNDMARNMCDPVMLVALGHIQTLQEIILFCKNPRPIPWEEVEEVSRRVFRVLPDLPELFFGAEVQEGYMEMIYQYRNAEDRLKTIYILRSL